MKKLFWIVLLIYSTIHVKGQDYNKEKIRGCFTLGVNLMKSLQYKTDTILKTNISPSIYDSLQTLIYEDPNRIRNDIYYNYQENCLVFSFYSGEQIDNETDWGLFNYNYIVDIYFKYKNEGFEIIKVNAILGNQIEKKNWWQNLMHTYSNEKNKRDTWAKDYNLIPPPPPPPETTEWFK